MVVNTLLWNLIILELSFHLQLISYNLYLVQQDYIAVKERHATYLPHTAGRYSAKRFRKAQVILFVMEAGLFNLKYKVITLL